MQGLLGEKLIADLIRELARKKASGLLRLSQGKAIKALFFESGALVFAISNKTTEQFEQKLLDNGLVSQNQIAQAKQRADKANRLGSVLVEMGALTEDTMRATMREQVMNIICSLFEWNEGEYVFDERMRAVHEVTLDMSVHDILLEGARRAARIEHIANAIAPPNGVIVRARNTGISVDSGRLVPVESYVLSRIGLPTVVKEVGGLSGLSDEDAHQAVCALMAAGFLKLVNGDKPEKGEPEAEEETDRLRQDVARKLHFFRMADHYEVLEVTRQSAAEDIKTAYYRLAKKYHPDRHRHLEDEDLKSDVEAMFSQITHAYETLSQPGQRAAYNDQLRGTSSSSASSAPVASPIVTPLPHVPATTPLMPLESPAPVADRKPSDDLKPSTPQSEKGDSVEEPAKEPPVDTKSQPAAASNPSETAEHYYQQGRALYDRKEYHKAVHMLREAIRIDPSRPPYHFHLGVALIRNPRTRHEADRHLVKAAELDPYNAQVRVKLGLIYKDAGLPKKAENYFRQALTMDPDNQIARREIKGAVKKPEARKFWKADLGSMAKRLFKR